MFERVADLILELVAENGRSAAASAGGVSALNHKVWYDSMEDGAVVVAAGCECGKVLARLGGVRGVEFDLNLTL